MINVLHNFTKLDEYPYYHICFYKKDRTKNEKFDLSKEKIFEEIRRNDNLDFKVLGTLERVDLCLRYINEKLNEGIFGCDLTRNDIFESDTTIFVDCTKVFK